MYYEATMKQSCNFVSENQVSVITPLLHVHTSVSIYIILHNQHVHQSAYLLKILFNFGIMIVSWLQLEHLFISAMKLILVSMLTCSAFFHS